MKCCNWWFVGLAVALVACGGVEDPDDLSSNEAEVVGPNCPASPEVETCNTLDDDCDGVVDETLADCACETCMTCPAGYVDMLDWMTMDADLRGTTRLASASHPLYTQVEANRFWWLKTEQGDTWDLNRYDERFIFFASTEQAFHSPWACKPAVQLGQWKAARRCVKIGSPKSDTITNTSSQFTLTSSDEVQQTSGIHTTMFQVRDASTMTWGDLGALPTLVLDYHWDGNIERYYLTQRYGLVRWQLTRNDNVLAESTFGTKTDNVVAPEKIYACNRAATYEQASPPVSGLATSGSSVAPSLDEVGRFLAYESISDNLIVDDTNGTWDVFVRDTNLMTTIRASVASDGAQADGPSHAPAMAGGGRYVAFESDASNLVAGDTNGTTDIFVFDRKTGKTTRVSVGPAGAQADGPSHAASISADGCRIAFESEATNLVVGDTNDGPGPFGVDVFVRDRCTQVTRRASVSNTGAQTMHVSREASISPDGRFVAYISGASDLVPGDTNSIQDVFVYDWFWNVTTDRASTASDETQTNNQSNYPRISRDGRYVAFISLATNLVPGDTNGQFDVFVKDRWQTGAASQRALRAASLSRPETYGGYLPQITADGRFVAFLAPSQSSPGEWVPWSFDMWTGQAIAPRSPLGTLPANTWPAGIAIAARNRDVAGMALADRITLAFVSTSIDMVPNDNAGADVFTRTVRAP